MVGTVARSREQTPGGESPDDAKKRSGSPRPETMKSVNLYKDVAQWAKELAEEKSKEEKRTITIGVYLDARLREWLWNEYQAMLKRKARKAEGKGPPPPPTE